MIVLEASDFFAFVWVTPEKIDHLLVVFNVVRS